MRAQSERTRFVREAGGCDGLPICRQYGTCLCLFLSLLSYRDAMTLSPGGRQLGCYPVAYMRRFSVRFSVFWR